MNSLRKQIVWAAAGFLLCMASSAIVSRGFVYPLAATKLSPMKDFVIMDLTGTLTGMRRFAADIAWIQFLQYYGSPEKPLEKDVAYKLSIDTVKFLIGMKAGHTHGGHEEHGEGHHHHHIEGGTYSALLTHCYRVTELDPFFYHAYLFGAGALAWNHERTQEALELLQNGIDNMEKYRMNLTKDVHQPYWQMNLYAAAIVYRKSGNFDKMVSSLEVAVKQPECPNLMKAVLANIYQKDGKLRKAFGIWIDIYQSGDNTYVKRAEEKITELKTKLGINN
ncbi:MAG: hypothetical protein ABII64_00840 [Elusimicrobiota bacterium]